VVHDLISAAQAVTDERAFIRLLQMMAVDRQDEQQMELAKRSAPYSAGANGWDNCSIEASWRPQQLGAKPRHGPLTSGQKHLMPGGAQQ
jgi:hypothetical protein